MPWLICGILCVLYYVVLQYLDAGQQMTFLWLILAGIFFFQYGHRLYRLQHPHSKLPLWFRTFCYTTVILALVMTVVVEIRIVIGMFDHAEDDLSYVVILNQEEMGTETEKNLLSRLETAVSYAERNPKTQIIVCGGWDSKAGSADAYTMYQYLVTHGISPWKISWETHSRTMKENIKNSMEIAGGPYTRIGIVADDYASYRAVRIARNLGATQAEGLPVATPGWLLPHHLLKELICVLQDKFMGI